MKMAVFIGQDGKRFAVQPDSVEVYEGEFIVPIPSAVAGGVPAGETKYQVRVVWKDSNDIFVVLDERLSFDDAVDILNHALNWEPDWEGGGSSQSQRQSQSTAIG